MVDINDEIKSKSERARRIALYDVTKRDMEDILKTMTKRDMEYMMVDGDEYLPRKYAYGLLNRFICRDDEGRPVAFADIYDYGDMSVNIVLGTRRGSQYRGHGYATQAVGMAVDWYAKNKRHIGKPLIWGVKIKNEPSIRIAKKYGFVEEPRSKSNSEVNYILEETE